MDPRGPLPTEQDFNPWGADDLDAQSAWMNFGGLTIEQAKVKFDANPLIYLEDFMYMGGRAFAYYFPVIDGHLRTVPDQLDDDDNYAMFLACSIANQFDTQDIDDVKRLAPAVLDLANFVLTTIDWFAVTERTRVTEAWTNLICSVEAAIGR